MRAGSINFKSNNVTTQVVCFLSPFLLLIVGLVEFKDTNFSQLIVDTAIVALFVLFAMLLGKVRKYDLSYFKWASIATVVILPFYLLSRKECPGNSHLPQDGAGRYLRSRCSMAPSSSNRRGYAASQARQRTHRRCHRRQLAPCLRVTG